MRDPKGALCKTQGARAVTTPLANSERRKLTEAFVHVYKRRKATA